MLKQIGIVSAMLVLDGIWISAFMGPLYQKYLGSFLQMSQGSRLYMGLLLVYALMMLGLFLFVLKPGISLLEAILFGAVLYGVFALTNFVIFANWPVILVFADTLWGGFLYSAMWCLAKWMNYI